MRIPEMGRHCVREMQSVEDKEHPMHGKRTEHWNTFTVRRIEAIINDHPGFECGYLVWTHREGGEAAVRDHIEGLRARGIRRLRTNVSWAEWYHKENRGWIDWYLREYAKELHTLPCLSFTPPEIGQQRSKDEWLVNVPPKKLEDYAAFVDHVLTEWGGCFGEEIELWNEWNLDTDWNPAADSSYEQFTAMVNLAADVVHAHGKRVLLGGMSKVNEDTLRWLAVFKKRRLRVDAIGIHNLRGTWSDHVPPPPLSQQVQLVRNVWGLETSIALTEYGFPVADPENRFDFEWLEDVQVAVFAYAVYTVLIGALETFYWYTYRDRVHVSLRQATTGWEDVLQFYYGDTEEIGRKRKLAKLLLDGGPLNVLRTAVREGLMPLVDEASLGRKLPEP